MTRSNLFFGLVLIGVGTLFLFDQLELVDAWPLMADWWPSVVILAGVGQLLTRPRNTFGGLTIAAIGSVLLLWTLGIIEGIGMLWPVLLIALGVWLLVGRRAAGSVLHGESYELLALFDDRRDAPVGTFAGGEIVTLFGDAVLDVRDMVPESDDPVLQITTIFGDVDLTVPDTWDVRVSGPEIFGDVNMRSPRPTASPEVVLRLHVVAIFGDIDIRAAAPDSQEVAP